MDDMTGILQRLHDSEINAQISWFYDDGFRWELGDNLNGWTTDSRALTAKAAISALAETAFAKFPRSGFAAGGRNSALRAIGSLRLSDAPRKGLAHQGKIYSREGGGDPKRQARDRDGSLGQYEASVAISICPAASNWCVQPNAQATKRQKSDQGRPC
jgi:hypothetical protein